MDDRKNKLLIIKDFTADIERTLATGPVKCEPPESISLTELLPSLHFPKGDPPMVQSFSQVTGTAKAATYMEKTIAASTAFSMSFSTPGNLDQVEMSLSRDVEALISKVSKTGRLFDSVHTTLQCQVSKLEDNAYKEQVKAIARESEELQEEAWELICDSQKLAIKAAVFVDDFSDVADKVSLLLTQDVPVADKLSAIAHYTKWVDERSKDAEQFRNQFRSLKKRVSSLPEKPFLSVSLEEQAKVLVAQDSVTSWVRRDRVAQVIAFSSVVVSGPVGWGMLAGGLAFKAICMDATATARKVRAEAEAPRLEATRAVKTCMVGFSTIADEISDFVNVWQLAGTMLAKIGQQLSLTNVEEPEMLIVRFNKLVKMFRGLGSSLEMYSAATFNL